LSSGEINLEDAKVNMPTCHLDYLKRFFGCEADLDNKARRAGLDEQFCDQQFCDQQFWGL
jgi:hypothetical protein